MLHRRALPLEEMKFANPVAAPAMSSPWSGFLPGLVYGLETMMILSTKHRV